MSEDLNMAAIHFHSNKHKALNCLLGILTGISSDRLLNEIEAAFLRSWILENSQLRADPDCIDLIDCLNDVLASAHPGTDQLDDALNLINDVIRFRSKEIPSQKHDQANKLLGIIKGISADSKISDVEISALRDWCYTLNDQWPANEIRSRIDEVLADGIVTKEERSSLVEFLKSFGCSRFMETGSSESMTLSLGCDEVDEIIYSGAKFCFSGTFLHGTRSKCEETIQLKGGKISSINKSLSYLILGSFPSKDWITSSYGLKIQKALELKSKGHPLKLITEETWSRFL